MISAEEVYANAAPFVASLTASQQRDTNFVRLGTGSGFLVRGQLVTCAHNLRIPADASLTALLLHANWLPKEHGGFHYEKPLDAVKAFSEEHSYDYAVLEALTDRSQGLEFGDRLPMPGEPVCSMGYAFEDSSLNIHQGIVSSVNKSGVATMLTLDMSVNPGNSGGPLISLIDGKVIGIVVRKATGLSTAFDQLMSTMKSNIEVFQKTSGGVFISGIDPISAFKAIQAQMLGVSEQIKRSAMVGIGYAIHVDPLLHEQVFQQS